MTLPAGQRETLLAWLEASGAVARGHFALSSGRHAGSYVQCARLLEEPARARQLGAWLAAPAAAWGAESVLSPALGGVIIGHEVAAALGVPFRFAERHEGSLALRRGFRLAPGERVLIVEDVVTTGGSTLETARLVAAAQAAWVGAAAILDRSGASPLPAPFLCLLRLDLPSWSAPECPLCAAGTSPAERPGSRGSAAQASPPATGV